MFLSQPISAYIVPKISSLFSVKQLIVHKVLVFVLTYIVYLNYHLGRRSLSIVKPSLNHKSCPKPDVSQSMNDTDFDEYWCDWAPFVGDDAKSLMGTLDLVFLISYSVSMYINAMIAERMNLRYFLTIGLILSGICNVLFGIAFNLNIHSLGYFYAIQVLTGITYSTGWPGVLSTVGNWFGPSKRGLIFGIWDTHLYLGDIVGTSIAGIFVSYNWGLSFIVPGIIVSCTGILVLLLLVPKPEDVNISLETTDRQSDNISVDSLPKDTDIKAIGILEAIKIPGVIEFSICLFFAKLVSYTFLDWLPYYISETNAISSSESAYMTIMFDVGGMAGGISAGYLSDKSGTGALTCIFMLTLAIPSMGIYYLFGNTSDAMNQLLQFIAGVFVNAPYALITTAISADLGSKVPSKSALATVSGIIDATGSIGAAIGPSLSGVVSNFGWNYVFILVMISDFLALLSIIRIGFNEIKQLITKFKSRKSNNNFRQEIAVPSMSSHHPLTVINSTSNQSQT